MNIWTPQASFALLSLYFAKKILFYSQYKFICCSGEMEENENNVKMKSGLLYKTGENDMEQRNRLFFYCQKDGITEKFLERLIHEAREHGFEPVPHHEEANIIISVGGDGTFLQAVRQSRFRQNALYAGINTTKNSSLYCDFDLHSFDDFLHTILNEEMEVRKFPVITTKVNDSTPFYCLNELTIRSTIVKTIVINVYIDNKYFETFRGDGLVVATPTGSTGYNKSANGAVVDPLLPSFQVSEIDSLNNNDYRTLGSSFILSKNRHLQLEVIEQGNDHPIVSFDNEAFPIRKINNIEVYMEDLVVKTIKLKNNTYWDRVRRMFL